jgi:hypothetical protein
MRIIMIILLLLFSVSCQGQSEKKVAESIKVASQKVSDTLSVLSLKNIPQNNYIVLYLSFSESSEDKIRLMKYDTIVSDISLPITDVDVKNFSVDKIKETNNGFKLSVNWGGGNDFYGRDFYFEFVKNSFYLNRLESKSYHLDSKKEISREERIIPPVSINKFILSEYIKNE